MVMFNNQLTKFLKIQQWTHRVILADCSTALGLTTKWPLGTFEGDRNVLYLYCDSSYKAV